MAALSVVVYYLFDIGKLLHTPRVRPNVNVADFSIEYNADNEIKEALAWLKEDNSKAMANVITNNEAATRNQVTLTFDGLAERSVIQRVLDLLKKHDMKAIFFVDALQASEDPQTIDNILKEGHQVESYTFAGMAHMERLPMEQLVRDFCRSQKVIKVTTGNQAKFLKCNDTVYDEKLLRAAKASGFESVVMNDVIMDVVSLSSIGSIDELVAGVVRPGSIISVKLIEFPEEIKPEEMIVDLRPAIDRKPGIKKLPTKISSSESIIVSAVEKLLTSLEKANYSTIDTEYVNGSSRVFTPATVRS